MSIYFSVLRCSFDCPGLAIGEAIGEAKGTRTMLFDFLSERFGDVPPHITHTLDTITDASVLRQLAQAVFKTASLAEFEALLPNNENAIKFQI